MKKYRKMKMIRTVVVLICVAVVVLFSVFYKKKEPEIEISSEETTETITEEVQNEPISLSPSEENTEIYVYITGAVQNPGVYVLKKDARVYEVIELCGGLLDTADLLLVNQAAVLVDGEQVTIPEIGMDTRVPVLSYEEEEIKSVSKSNSDENLININTADKNELLKLPSIGEKKAEAILLYRNEHGPFSDISEIKNVTGIGETIFNQIKDQIKV